ncbi:hypothetical protein ACSU64_03450 [Bacillaceae bacterium C204]|uniref:hypothetical protein n=1 Tax=Neobacillus sp. 204 TaxID=3383351 RepID=UPI00397D8667
MRSAITPIKKLDEVTGGFQGGELTILAARSSMMTFPRFSFEVLVFIRLMMTFSSAFIWSFGLHSLDDNLFFGFLMKFWSSFA